MDETAYKPWWELHIRVCRGQPLTAEEQTLYDCGLKQLHEEEKFYFDETGARKGREELQTARAEHKRLLVRIGELDAEIAALESTLAARARQAVKVEG